MVSPAEAAFTALWMSPKLHVGKPAVHTVKVVAADADAAGMRIAPMASAMAPANLGEVRFIVNLRLRVQAPPLVQSVRPAARMWESHGVSRASAMRLLIHPMRRGIPSAIPQTVRLFPPDR